ncbi:MAG: prepilin-type N-terminal cleavage/methylation domain-containing protein [Firmicutes bacterium]|nr:prepilin-type N-terminal cleavage/methylation domain-containing protein [Bacillota bacterium]
MFPKTGKRQKGVSLLELLISIMLLTTVMMTFAMVFPGGYRLNLKNRMESKASKIANGILYKMQNMPFLGTSLTQPTVENMQNWDTGTFADQFENTVERPFYLPAKSDTNPGISVKILDPTVGNGGTLARIAVTIAWTETNKGGVITKKVTVTAYRSRNHQ